MKENALKKINEVLISVSNAVKNSSEEQLEYKLSLEKWSKKEIVGHLVDSAINNLQRFTEIQFENKPYKIRTYNQDQLVKANYYNQINSQQLLDLWLSLNRQIINVIENISESRLSYEIEFLDGSMYDLNFLINDYANHLEHHSLQITDKKTNS